MAGQPKRRAMFELLEQRATDYFEGDPTQTALDYVACWIEDGQTINELSAELSRTLGHTVQREWIGTSLRKTFGADAVDERLANARSRASHTLAEASIDISDGAAETSVGVARNGLRARARQWAAERWNPQQYGQSKGVNVSISLGGLHLTALQAVNREVTSGVQIAPNNAPIALPERT